MFDPKDLFQLGKLGKTFGNQGELRISFSDNSWPAFIEEYEFVFIRVKGDYLPFRIKELQEDLVKLDKIDSPEQANALAGKVLFVPIKDIDPLVWNQLDTDNLLFQLSDWKIYDAQTEKYYEPVQIEEYPQQTMATFSVDGNAAIIPINEQTLQKIDVESKTIYMDISEEIWALFI